MQPASKEKAGVSRRSYDTLYTHERRREGIDSVLGLVAHRHRQAGVLNRSDAAPIANAPVTALKKWKCAWTDYYVSCALKPRFFRDSPVRFKNTENSSSLALIALTLSLKYPSVSFRRLVPSTSSFPERIFEGLKNDRIRLNWWFVVHWSRVGIVGQRFLDCGALSSCCWTFNFPPTSRQTWVFLAAVIFKCWCLFEGELPSI